MKNKYHDYFFSGPRTICNVSIKRKIFYEKLKSELENFLRIATKIREDLDVYIEASELLNTDKTSTGTIYTTISTYLNTINTINNDIINRQDSYNKTFQLITDEIDDTRKSIHNALDKLDNITTENVTENVEFQELTKKKRVLKII